MRRRKLKIYELNVDKLAFGGKGLARKDNLVVFVDDAVPGDRVMAQVTKKRKDYLEARTIEILQPSEDRIEAPCKYFQHCGGCKWQNLTYEKQLQYKGSQVVESLQRIGGIKKVPIEPIIAADPIFAYRNKMEFSFSQRRWLTPEELNDKTISMQFALGLHVPGTFEKVLDIDRCLLQSELGNTILQRVKKWAKESGIEAYHLRNQDGVLRFLVLRHSSVTGEMMVNLVTTEDISSQFKSLAAQIAGEFPQIVSVLNSINNRKAQIAFCDEEILVYGRSYIIDGIADLRFEISANSFFQTNTTQAEKLYSLVAEFAGLSGREVVLDLYSGTGTIAIFLARKAKEVIGIELIEEAVKNAKKNALFNHANNCRFITGDMKDVFPRQKIKPDVLVVDPPRAGLHGDVLSAIIDLAPEKVVYVSCNPGTLARDLQLLTPTYSLERIRAVDMFPHTCHIESVSLLSKRH